MATLTSVSYLIAAGDQGRSRITDLEVMRLGGVDTLVSITRFDGAVQSWRIDGATLTTGPLLGLGGGDVAGGKGALVALNDTALLIGGGANGTFQQIGMVNGTLQPVATLPGGAGFQPGLVVQVAGGGHVVYGGLPVTDGIAAMHFTAQGQFAQAGQITATGGPVAALTMAQGYVFAAETNGHSLSGWQVDPDGSLRANGRLTADDGLWIADPSALRSATVDGVTYLVLAAAGSSSLSVIEVGATGNLTIRDHLIDTRDTRFAGVTALDVVTEAGRTYVIAGGADDGISVFLMLPGGMLVGLAHLADTPSTGLDNVSALAARGRDGGVDIFVASSSEAGLTQLRLDPGVIGPTISAQPGGGALIGTAGSDILLGGPGNDSISGGAGNDFIRDGPGTDVLTGGPGADVFILSADGQSDRLTDFELGVDRLDLSAWPMLRDITQLTMNLTPTGFRIIYGDEELIVDSADGQTLDYRLLTNADVLGGMRLPANLVPGFAGPLTPPPSLLPPLPEPAADQGGPFSYQNATSALAAENFAAVQGIFQRRPVDVAGEDRALIGTDTNDALVSAGGNDLLLGRAGNDFLIGGAGADILIAGRGNNELRGGDGHDLLIGGPGNDRLDGGDGDDLLIAGGGNNRLDGGRGNDVLIGGDGDDWLRGGPGDDIMTGGAGADAFVFAGGHDVITDFELGIDQLVFGVEVFAGLTNVTDLMLTYARVDGNRTVFDLGDGDLLWVEGVTDLPRFADDIALF